MVAEMFLSWLGMDYWVRELSSTYPLWKLEVPSTSPRKKVTTKRHRKGSSSLPTPSFFRGVFQGRLLLTIMEPEINSRQGEMVDQILYF